MPETIGQMIITQYPICETLEEAEELLASADMAFNPYNKRDKLVIQCITHGQYDIDEVNAMLFVCEQPLLGN